MNLAITLCLIVFCGFSLAQDEGDATERSACGTDFCDFLIEYGAMTEKVNSMETRLTNTETKLADSETRLTDAEAKLADSETRLADIERQIVELQNKEKTKVIFSATAGGGGTLGPYNIDATLLFKRVITNIGGAYSYSTGVFTAPVAGVYYFSFFYHAGGHYASKLSLYKNSELLVMTSDHQASGDGADNGGNAVFVQLKQGDRVYIRMAANTNVWAADRRTTFSGYLVTQT